MRVSLKGYSIPLYGIGWELAASDESGGIPLKLEFDIHSTGYLVGKLVKTKHTRRISCSLVISSKYTKKITFQQKSCKYFWKLQVCRLLEDNMFWNRQPRAMSSFYSAMYVT